MSLADLDAQLLPCPFCGSPAEHYPDGDMEGYDVMCSASLGACKMTTFSSATSEDAAAMWNRRAALASQAPAVQRDPVAVDVEVLHTMLGQIRGAYRNAVDAAYVPSSQPFKAANKGFYSAVESLNKVISLIAAPSPQGDAEDAARYRWLRDKSEPGVCAFYLSVGKAFDGVKFNQATVDFAIDTARKAAS